MKEILLSARSGPVQKIQVDDEVFLWASNYSWSKHTKKGYAQTAIKVGESWKCILLHRVVMGFTDRHTGEQLDSRDVDHRDRNTFNNQRGNLRPCSRPEGTRNKRAYSGNQYKGVSKAGKKWQARIHDNHTAYYLGVYLAPEEAARAYDRKAIELFGEFAGLNFPLEHA